jgi:F-type H+-transporting ATPase subunit gamma
MRRQVELERRLRTLHGLGEAVRAMKSLSAHHFRQARAAVLPARSYRQGVEHILEQFGGWATTRSEETGPAGLVIIGAELGLCGGYNARLVEAGAAHRDELGDGPTFAVGRRFARLLGRSGVRVDRSYEGPTGVGGISALLLALAEEIVTAYTTERLSCFEIVASRFEGVGVTSPAVVRLLPIESIGAEMRRRPRYVAAEELAAAALREYLYITLWDLLLDALASEHGARLVTTQSAEHWLDHRTEKLRRQLMATRREASTQEMIELAAGTRARRAGG